MRGIAIKSVQRTIKPGACIMHSLCQLCAYPGLRLTDILNRPRAAATAPLRAPLRRATSDATRLSGSRRVLLRGPTDTKFCEPSIPVGFLDSEDSPSNAVSILS